MFAYLEPWETVACCGAPRLGNRSGTFADFGGEGFRALKFRGLGFS